MSKYVDCAQMPGKFCPRVECRFPSHNLSERGFTMIEVMVGIVVIGIAALAVISSFGYIARAVVGANNRTIANSLTEERLESITILGYRYVIPTSEDDLLVGYDNTYFPPQTLTAKGYQFTTYVKIRKVTEASGQLVNLEPDDPDDGLRKIMAWTKWSEGDNDFTVTLTNVVYDPNRSIINATFEGTVRTNPDEPTPLAGAKVEIVENGNWCDTSDANGDYSIKVSSGTYNLKATKKGYNEQTIGPFAIASQETQAGKDFLLTKVGEGTISGVVRSTDSQPVGGAILTCDDEISYLYSQVISSYVTGEYSFPNVSTGTWAVYASSAGLALAGSTTGVIVLDGLDTSCDVVLSTTLASGSISGKVTKSDGESPLGILVVASGVENTCDSDGNYVLSNVEAGDYQVTANAYYTDSDYTQGTTSCTVVAGEVTSGIDFTIMSCGSISGNVTMTGGDPLKGIVVQAFDGTPMHTARGTTLTDVSGDYILPHLPILYNDYTVELILDPEDASTPEKYEDQTVTKGGEIQNLDFLVTPAWGEIYGDVEYNNSPIQTGVLVMASTGLISLQDIDDSFRSGNLVYGTMSDNEGDYLLKVRRGNTYSIYAWYTEVSGGGTLTTQKTGSADLTTATTAYVGLDWP